MDLLTPIPGPMHAAAHIAIHYEKPWCEQHTVLYNSVHINVNSVETNQD